MTTKEQQKAIEGAAEAFMTAYHAYGQYPTETQLDTIKDGLVTYMGDKPSCAVITAALATCHDISWRRTQKPNLMYQGHEVMPEDELYTDALADYEHDNETTLYRIIQQATKE